MQFTKSAGSEFHFVIDLGKKENLKTSLDTFGILYLKAWLLRVLFSLSSIKCRSVLISIRLWLSLYIRVNLFFSLLVSNVSHFRSENMPVTLAVLLKFWRQKRAAFLWTLSKVEISFLLHFEGLNYICHSCCQISNLLRSSWRLSQSEFSTTTPYKRVSSANSLTGH